VESSAQGAYQLGSGTPTTVNQLLEHMRAVTGLDLEVLHQDFRAGEVRDTWCEIEKARASFGFDPATHLEDGLRQTWEWFRAQQA
jgi:UDP-glucose 4-epimerase